MINDAFLRVMANQAAHAVLTASVEQLAEIKRLVDQGGLSFTEMPGPNGIRAFDVRIPGFSLLICQANEETDGVIHRGTAMVLGGKRGVDFIVLNEEIASYIYHKVVAGRN